MFLSCIGVLIDELMKFCTSLHNFFLVAKKPETFFSLDKKCFLCFWHKLIMHSTFFFLLTKNVFNVFGTK